MFVGVDVGGTKLEAILVETKTSPQTLLKLRAPTERDLGYSHIISRISELIKELLKTSKNKITAIGIGLPGSIDPVTNIMVLGNTHALENKPIIDDLKKSLNANIPIFLENDANAFALAEVYAGVGLDYQKSTGILPKNQNAMGIILGTGVGCGLIIKGQIVKGRRGSGGEAGHTTLYYDGIECYCERKGCVEQYLSGPAVEKQYQEKTGTKKTTTEIFNDPLAKEIISGYIKNLNMFLGNLTNVLDPDYFVLGGGVSKQDALYVNSQKEIQKNLFVKQKPPAILKHKISDSSGSLGAALVAWKESQ